MKRFVMLYFFFLLLLFVGIYLPTTPFAVWINSIQTKMTLLLLDSVLSPGQMHGIDIWINAQYKIIITQACNGIIPVLFLFASLLAYPSSLLHKLRWMFIGYIIFLISNVLRLWFVVMVTQQGNGHADFYWSHDIIGNLFLLCIGMVLFVMFIKTSAINS